MKTLVSFVCCYCLLFSTAMAQNFSVDVGQPDTMGGFPPPADILAPGFPPTPVVPGGIAGVNVDAFSFNALGPTPIDGGFAPIFDFSVDLIAVGAPGTSVMTEAAAGEAETDVFRSFGFGGNGLIHDGDGSSPSAFGPLGILEAAASSIGGVDGYDSQPTGPPLAGGIYWSVDAPSLGISPYPGLSAADVFFGGYAAGPAVYASEAALGLMTGDELDALQVYDRGTLGTFDAGDAILFSLDPTSPSLGVLGVAPGDILLSGAGGFLGVIVPDVGLGLAPGDNLNALSVSQVPEPGALSLLAGIGCMLMMRRRKHGALR